VKVAGVFLSELQVNDFPNIQVNIRLEGDAGFADVRAHTILGNHVYDPLADDAHWYADSYAVFPAPLEWKQSGFRHR